MSESKNITLWHTKHRVCAIWPADLTIVPVQLCENPLLYCYSNCLGKVIFSISNILCISHFPHACRQKQMVLQEKQMNLFTHNSSVQTELYAGVMGCSKKPQKWGIRYATNGSKFNFWERFGIVHSRYLTSIHSLPSLACCLPFFSFYSFLASFHPLSSPPTPNLYLLSLLLLLIVLHFLFFFLTNFPFICSIFPPYPQMLFIPSLSSILLFFLTHRFFSPLPISIQSILFFLLTYTLPSCSPHTPSLYLLLFSFLPH